MSRVEFTIAVYKRLYRVKHSKLKISIKIAEFRVGYLLI